MPSDVVSEPPSKPEYCHRNVINMSCRVKRKLAEYQVGALPEPARAEVARHVAQCPACQAELTALERTAALLRPMARADAPPQVWAGVARQMTPRHAPALRRMHWTPAFAAAMLIVVVALAVLVPVLHGHFAHPAGTDAYADLQVAAAWNSPLADKAALGLALIATEDADPLQDLQEIVN